MSMTNTETEQKSIGHLKEITFDLTEPLKMQALKMSFDKASKELPPILDRMGNLNVLIGANGTGKTFVLVNVWCLATIANHGVIQFQIDSYAPDYLKESAQFTYDNSFSKQNLTGKVEAVFTSGALVSLEFKKGKILKAEVLGVDSSFGITLPVFMSSQMRTFEAISMYLKIRKRIKAGLPELDPLRPNQEMENEITLLQELCKDFKLYDIQYVESTIKRCPITISKELNKTLREFGGFNDGQDYKILDVDLEQGDFYVTQGKSKKKLYLSTFSKGHQAIFNMFVTLATQNKIN